MRMEDENPAVPNILEKINDIGRFDKKFLDERKIFLWGAVHDESAEKIVNKLLFLESDKPGEEITFYINSPGGVVTSGMIIMDVMKMMKSPVKTVCIGMAASMGSLLLSAGTKGKRLIYPSGRVMIHQPSIQSIQGQASDMEITARQILKTKELSAKILAENCGQTFEKVMKDFDRDYWMDAQESLTYGIVDGIATEL